MKIKLGTNRLTLICKKYVYKLALHKRGYAANLQEYKLSVEHDFVAKTELHWYGLKQERLTDIVVYPRYATKEQVQKQHQFLFDKKLHNKLQVGKDINGDWKVFDYEDVKFYIRHEKE